MKKVTFRQVLEHFRARDLERVVCWACNNFMWGSGYCARHSTSGMSYRANYYSVKAKKL